MRLRRVRWLMPDRHERGPIGRDAGLQTLVAEGERALREAAAVRNALHTPNRRSALGQAHTMASLDRGAVRELLLTPRFIEMNPGAAITACRSSSNCGARVTVVHGVAALHLDVIADGIAVIPRYCGPTTNS